MPVVYDPDYYFIKNIDDAKGVILGPWSGFSASQRWKSETEWLAQRIKFDDDEGLIVDYACGIGRIAKGIKNPILGVDFSQSMRINAEAYVNKNSFSVVTPEILKVLFDNGLKISGVISIWALQHVIEVEETIGLLMKALKPEGIFWLMDLNQRCIPITDTDKPIAYNDKFTQVFFHDDKKEILPMIDRWCILEYAELMPIYDSGPKLELMKYRRR